MEGHFTDPQQKLSMIDPYYFDDREKAFIVTQGCLKLSVPKILSPLSIRGAGRRGGVEKMVVTVVINGNTVRRADLVEDLVVLEQAIAEHNMDLYKKDQENASGFIEMGASEWCPYHSPETGGDSAASAAEHNVVQYDTVLEIWTHPDPAVTSPSRSKSSSGGSAHNNLKDSLALAMKNAIPYTKVLERHSSRPLLFNIEQVSLVKPVEGRTRDTVVVGGEYPHSWLPLVATLLDSTDPNLSAPGISQAEAIRFPWESDVYFASQNLQKRAYALAPFFKRKLLGVYKNMELIKWDIHRGQGMLNTHTKRIVYGKRDLDPADIEMIKERQHTSASLLKSLRDGNLIPFDGEMHFQIGTKMFEVRESSENEHATVLVDKWLREAGLPSTMEDGLAARRWKKFMAHEGAKTEGAKTTLVGRVEDLKSVIQEKAKKFMLLSYKDLNTLAAPYGPYVPLMADGKMPQMISTVEPRDEVTISEVRKEVAAYWRKEKQLQRQNDFHKLSMLREEIAELKESLKTTEFPEALQRELVPLEAAVEELRKKLKQGSWVAP
eukprot:Filipodium_phascolosomae@DN2334_c0_g1_i1.p1